MILTILSTTIWTPFKGEIIDEEQDLNIQVETVLEDEDKEEEDVAPAAAPRHFSSWQKKKPA
jgi:hypothetical protein